MGYMNGGLNNMAKIIQAIEVSYYHLLCDKCNMKVGKINTMDISPSVLRCVVCADCYKEVADDGK